MGSRRGTSRDTGAERADEAAQTSCSVEWSERITARACLFVALDGEKVIGPRFVRLLREISAEGSVRGAARRMNIGHRHAIAWIQGAEALLGRPLVQRHAGGAGGGGATLTAAGETLVQAYLGIEADIKRRLVSARTEVLGGEE
jgi:molybdate transport repressor ModE-like protein